MVSVNNSEKFIRRLYEITHNYPLVLKHKQNNYCPWGFNLDIGILAKIENNEYIVKNCVVPKNVDINSGLTFDLDNTICQITCEADGPVALEYIGKHEQYASHPAYLSTGIESYIGIPITLNGESYGTLNFSSSTPYNRKFKDVDIDVLNLMASWIETEMIRRRQEKLVIKRTHDLTTVNEKLKTEIIKRKNIALELEEREVNLKEAQRIANIGSWQLAVRYCE